VAGSIGDDGCAVIAVYRRSPTGTLPGAGTASKVASDLEAGAGSRRTVVAAWLKELPFGVSPRSTDNGTPSTRASSMNTVSDGSLYLVQVVGGNARQPSDDGLLLALLEPSQPQPLAQASGQRGVRGGLRHRFQAPPDDR